MPTENYKVAKGRMTLAERDLRSRLTRVAASAGLLHGTLDLRARTCGKQTCKCTRGEKHVSLYVVVNEGGQNRHLYVPNSRANEVRRWVENYQQLLALVDEISSLYWEKIRKREE